MRLGLFDAKSSHKNSYLDISTDVVGQSKHIEASRTIARKSMILLRNEDNTLPLVKGKRIAVVGNAADDGGAILGKMN